MMNCFALIVPLILSQQSFSQDKLYFKLGEQRFVQIELDSSIIWQSIFIRSYFACPLVYRFGGVKNIVK